MSSPISDVCKVIEVAKTATFATSAMVVMQNPNTGSKKCTAKGAVRDTNGDTNRDTNKGSGQPGQILQALTVATMLLLSTPLFAQPLPNLNGITKEASASSNYFAPQPGVTLKQATAIARKHTGGKVLSANPRKLGGVTEYRVRMLVDGERVVTLTVDSEGQIRERR